MVDWSLVVTFIGGFCLGVVVGVGGLIGWMAWLHGRAHDAYMRRSLRLDEAAPGPHKPGILW